MCIDTAKDDSAIGNVDAISTKDQLKESVVEADDTPLQRSDTSWFVRKPKGSTIRDGSVLRKPSANQSPSLNRNMSAKMRVRIAEEETNKRNSIAIICDQDQNGEITFEEFTEYSRTAKVFKSLKPTELRELFDRLEVDRNGFVEVEDLIIEQALRIQNKDY